MGAFTLLAAVWIRWEWYSRNSREQSVDKQVAAVIEKTLHR
jgi:hypothetical protein